MKYTFTVGALALVVILYFVLRQKGADDNIANN